MKKALIPSSIALVICLLFTSSGFAQQAKSEIRSGNRLFKAEKFDQSEVAYRKALDVSSNSVPGGFNLGDALYRQEKFEEAGEQFETIGNRNASKDVQANAYHNLGNSMLQAGKLDEAIDAFKNALRKVPSDMETKYNLAYAQNMKKKQEEQEQENKDEQNQDQDNKDQENKDQEQDQQNKDQENKDQQNQDQENKDQQDQDQQKQDQEKQDQEQQPQEGQISKADAERLLEALANDEKKTQQKVKLAKAKAKKVRTLKDW